MMTEKIITFIKLFLFAITLAMVAVFLTVSLPGCKSFDPKDYVVEGQPDVCNDFYITAGLYAHNGAKDFAFPAIVYGDCSNYRKFQLRVEKKEACRKLFFMDKPVNEEDHQQYMGYLKCVSTPD